MAKVSKKKIKKIKKITTTCLSVLIGVMVLLVGYLTYCNMSGKVAYIGKYAIMRIISQSMEPTIPTGKYILVTKTDTDSIKKNDVICFYSRDPSIYGRVNTHRVVEIKDGADGREFVTRGDNNNADDALTTKQEDVVGKYVKNLDTATRFADIFTKKWVFFFVIIVPAIILIAICVIDVIKKSKEVKMDYLVEQEIERLKAEAEKKD